MRSLNDGPSDTVIEFDIQGPKRETRRTERKASCNTVATIDISEAFEDDTPNIQKEKLEARRSDKCTRRSLREGRATSRSKSLTRRSRRDTVSDDGEEGGKEGSRPRSSSAKTLRRLNRALRSKMANSLRSNDHKPESDAMLTSFLTKRSESEAMPEPRSRSISNRCSKEPLKCDRLKKERDALLLQQISSNKELNETSIAVQHDEASCSNLANISDEILRGADSARRKNSPRSRRTASYKRERALGSVRAQQSENSVIGTNVRSGRERKMHNAKAHQSERLFTNDNRKDQGSREQGRLINTNSRKEGGLNRVPKDALEASRNSARQIYDDFAKIMDDYPEETKGKRFSIGWDSSGRKQRSTKIQDAAQNETLDRLQESRDFSYSCSALPLDTNTGW